MAYTFTPVRGSRGRSEGGQKLSVVGGGGSKRGEGHPPSGPNRVRGSVHGGEGQPHPADRHAAQPPPGPTHTADQHSAVTRPDSYHVSLCDSGEELHGCRRPGEGAGDIVWAGEYVRLWVPRKEELATM